jgi:hypothetical protein
MPIWRSEAHPIRGVAACCSAAGYGVTVMLALAGLPMPALEDTMVVVLFFTPAELAVRFTLNVQLPPAGSLALA